MRELPTRRSRTAGLYFSQAIIWVKEWPVLTRKDFMGSARVVLLRLEAKAPRTTSIEGITNATDTWTVKKVNPADDDSPDREAGRTGRAGDDVLLAS